MLAPATILAFAEADLPEPRSAGIELTAPQFAAAHWAAAFLASRTVETDVAICPPGDATGDRVGSN